MSKARTHGRRPYRPLTVTVDTSGRVNFRPVLVDPMSASLGTGDATEAGTRSVPARAFVTTMDQGVASVSNFAVGVVVARVSGVAGLGAFSLAYAAWIFIASLHRSLITDPMAIAGDARHPTDTRANIKRGFASEVLLGLAAGLVMALLGLVLIIAGQTTFGVSQLAVAPWIIFLLLQDYWRWIGFMQGRPGKALVNDLVFDLIQGIGFGLLFVAHIHSAPLAIAAWGLGALGGAALGLWQFRVWPSFLGGFAWLRKKWVVGGWLAATSTSTWGFIQLYGILTAVFLGPIGLGGLKAAQNLVQGPSVVLVQAGGSIGLPEASRAYDKSGWKGLNRISRVVTGAGVASVGLVLIMTVIFGRFLLNLFYGPQFGRYAPVAIAMAVAYLISVCNLGAVMKLKTTQQTHLLFVVSMIALVPSTVAVVVLTPGLGLMGAAYTFAIGMGCYVIGQVIAARWVARRHQSSADAGDDPAAEDAPAMEAIEVTEVPALASGS